MTRAIAVDFDGVIHAYRRGWQDGSIYDEPMPGALDALRQLMIDYAVFVHTSRDPEPVAEWLVQRGIPAVTNPEFNHSWVFWDDQTQILVTNRKLAAVAYVDGRAVRFESWEQALADLARHESGRSP